MVVKAATCAFLLALVPLSAASSLQAREAEAQPANGQRTQASIQALPGTVSGLAQMINAIRSPGPAPDPNPQPLQARDAAAEPANGQRTQQSIKALPGTIAGIAQLVQAIRAPGAVPAGNPPALRRRALVPGGDQGNLGRRGDQGRRLRPESPGYTIDDVQGFLGASVGSPTTPPMTKRDLVDVELLDLLTPELVARAAAAPVRSDTAGAIDAPARIARNYETQFINHTPDRIPSSKGNVPLDLGVSKLVRRHVDAEVAAETDAGTGPWAEEEEF